MSHSYEFHFIIELVGVSLKLIFNLFGVCVCVCVCVCLIKTARTDKSRNIRCLLGTNDKIASRVVPKSIAV